VKGETTANSESKTQLKGYSWPENLDRSLSAGDKRVKLDRILYLEGPEPMRASDNGGIGRVASSKCVYAASEEVEVPGIRKRRENQRSRGRKRVIVTGDG